MSITVQAESYVLLPVLCWSADHYVQRCGFKMESFPLRNGRGGSGKGCLEPYVRHVKKLSSCCTKKNSPFYTNQLKLEIDNIFLYLLSTVFSPSFSRYGQQTPPDEVEGPRAPRQRVYFTRFSKPTYCRATVVSKIEYCAPIPMPPPLTDQGLRHSLPRSLPHPNAAALATVPSR